VLLSTMRGIRLGNGGFAVESSSEILAAAALPSLCVIDAMVRSSVRILGSRWVVKVFVQSTSISGCAQPVGGSAPWSSSCDFGSVIPIRPIAQLGDNRFSPSSASHRQHHPPRSSPPSRSHHRSATGWIWGWLLAINRSPLLTAGPCYMLARRCSTGSSSNPASSSSGR
jgi:hypothetical protein